jgi:glycosyltransferase involved in cell wall biosynthesis
MLLFSQGLLELGYSVDFLVAQSQGPLRDLLPDGVRLVDLRGSKVSFTLPALVQYLKRERPIALYSSVVNANITALFARAIARSGCRVVVRESNVPNPKGTTIVRRVSGMFAPLIYRLADSVISVSEDVARMLCASSPELMKKISILPNPVVSDEMLAKGEMLSGHPWLDGSDSDIPVVLGAGRLHPQKDFTTLIAAFAEVKKKRDARLVILGEGSERSSLQDQIRKLGLEDCVSMPGFVDNPFPFFKRAKVFVLSSRYEGMPNVLLQAMAFGTPVVATDCDSGAREVIRNSGVGRLVTVGNHAGMARAILAALDDSVSKIAVDYVDQNYSVRRSTREYLQVVGL